MPQGDFESVDDVYRAVRDMSPNVAQSAVARAAVAVVLWRECAGAVQVYLAQRSPSLRFLGGYWSFPGGRVEGSDGVVEGPGVGDIKGVEIACAIREIREEVGIDLPLERQAYLHGGRWVTPSFLPIRFDTVYLVHRYDGAEPDVACSEGELVEGTWISTSEALRRWQDGSWLIPTPVLRTVRALDEHDPDAQGASEALEGRLRLQASAEAASARIWFPLNGIGLSPLATPTLPPATHTNCYFFGTQEVVVIDPASPYPEEQAELDRALAQLSQQGRRVVMVLLTHHHADHVGSAMHVAQALGVPIGAHRLTAERLRGKIAVDTHLSDGERIELAGNPPRRVKAVFTPGHAPGHLCFLEEETRAIAVGDMLAGAGTILIDPSEGDMGEYLGSLRRLLELDASFLLPAHGPLITEPRRKLEEYIKHRLWRERRVLDVLLGQVRATAPALVTLAYDDVPVAVHPFALRSLLAHLQKLSKDGLARLEGEEWVALERA